MEHGTVQEDALNEGVQLPVPCAIAKTSKVAAIAPPNAERSTIKLLIPNIMASSAATAAPPELPKI